MGNLAKDVSNAVSASALMLTELDPIEFHIQKQLDDAARVVNSVSAFTQMRQQKAGYWQQRRMDLLQTIAGLENGQA